MQINVRTILFLTMVSLLGAGTSARAGNIVFDFNHATLVDGASNTAIQSYMRGVIFSELGLVNAVTVWGAKVEKNYTGDGHVVGPCNGGPDPVACARGEVVTPLTLGSSDHGVQHALPWDGYIYNHDSIKFTMSFTFPIRGASFDYEIFPNGNCADPSATFPAPKGNCSVYPDFTFKAGNSPSTLSTVLHAVSADPSITGYLGPYTHSPVSGPISKEKSPQLLAVSDEFIFPAGVTRLEFYDWPERVGIDNLVISTPEPGTMFLLGTGLTAFVLKTPRRRKNSNRSK